MQNAQQCEKVELVLWRLERNENDEGIEKLQEN